MADDRLIKHEAFLAIALAALFLASPAVAEEGATTGDLRWQCLSRDPILHQRCLSYIAGVYEMMVGEVQLSSFELVSFGSSKQVDGQVHFLGFAEEASACSLVKGDAMGLQKTKRGTKMSRRGIKSEPAIIPKGSLLPSLRLIP